MRKAIISQSFDSAADFILYEGDCLKLLKDIPDGFVKMVITSPPYNLGKPYETRLNLEDYISQQSKVIKECVRVLDDSGSICWEVGNYVFKVKNINLLLYWRSKSLSFLDIRQTCFVVVQVD